VKTQRDGFGSAQWLALPVRRADLAEIQSFNESNPAYWMLTHGGPPAADDAQRVFAAGPPADMPCSQDIWLLVRDTSSRELAGHLMVATDLPASGVWHLGFFIVAGERQGTGFARQLHAGYERWATDGGARWLRLGVVEANVRAHAFWRRQGYAEVRRNRGYVLGAVTHVLITMVKPLSGTLAEYLQQVPRDRPTPR
jgi:GNAT superfamily N-acetyltransferase